MTADSPFLKVPESNWLACNALAFAFYDGFPVSPGHTLVVTRRVVATWFDASNEEREALMAPVGEVRELLDAQLAPDGYNVGLSVSCAMYL